MEMISSVLLFQEVPQDKLLYFGVSSKPMYEKLKSYHLHRESKIIASQLEDWV
jgi:hypothetical protein